MRLGEKYTGAPKTGKREVTEPAEFVIKAAKEAAV